jgi:hypothetical protein
VQLLGSKGDWAKVQKGDKTGFILKSCFVAPEAVVAEGVSAAAKKTLTTTANGKIYASASTSAASKKVKSGTKLTVVGEKGGWYKVVKSGNTGYMQKKAFER